MADNTNLIVDSIHVINDSVDGGILVCPICGDEMVHIDEITSYDNSYDAEYKYKNPLGCRGGGLQVLMWCESGHKWTLGLQQHKGWMHIYNAYAETEADHVRKD